MRWRILCCVCLLALAGASCQTASDDEPDAVPSASALETDDFTLTGLVIDAREGAQPADGIPGEDDAMSSSVGGVAIRPVEALDAQGLDDCETTQDAFVTYYTPETDTSGLDEPDSWPENLEGHEVTVEGTRHDASVADADESPSASPSSDSDGCVLVLDRIEPATTTTPSANDLDDGTQGGTQSGGAGGGETSSSATPDSSPEERVVWESPAPFPEHEDTDPVFEGTPSPDPCEGQKACEEHRETGQEPQP